MKDFSNLKALMGGTVAVGPACYPLLRTELGELCAQVVSLCNDLEDHVKTPNLTDESFLLCRNNMVRDIVRHINDLRR